MSGPWIAEWDDAGGPYVFHEGTRAGSLAWDAPRHDGHATEQEAWEYVLDCLVARRRLLASHITESRAMVRKLSRQRGATKGG